MRYVDHWTLSHLPGSSKRSSQFSPIDTTRSLPVKILSVTIHSPLLCPPAPLVLGGILYTLTSLAWKRVCSIVLSLILPRY